MLLKAFPVQIDIPESFHRFRDFRVNSEIIGEYAIRVVYDLLKQLPGHLNLAVQLIRDHDFRAVSQKCCDRFHGMLNTVKVGVEIHGTCRTGQVKHLIGVISSQLPDRNNTDQRRNTQRYDNRTHCQQGKSGTNRIHLSAFPFQQFRSDQKQHASIA